MSENGPKSGEEGILDDYSKIKNIKRVNYPKFTLIYIILMILIGGLLAKLVLGAHLSYAQQFLGACGYLLVAVLLFGFKTIGAFIYRQIKKKQLVIEHPAWFYVLEGIFTMWCVVVIITLIMWGLKINPIN